MKKNFVLILFFSGLFSCSIDQNESTENENLLLINNFDMLDGWNGIETPSLTKEKAHSGNYSVKTNQDIEFGVTFEKAIGELTKSKPKKVRLSAFAFSPGPEGKAALGFTIYNQDNQQILGDGINFDENVKEYNNWVKIEKVIDIPTTIATSDKLRIFLWRGNSTVPVYIDDLKVELIE